MPAEDGRRRVDRTLGHQTHTVSCKLVKPSHKNIGQAVSCSGRFADFVSQISSSSGKSKPWQGRSGTPPVPRPPNCTGAARPRSRDHATSKPGGDGKEREREKRLLVRSSASRSPPAPGGCWTPRRPHPPAPRARTGRPHQPAPVHAARAPRQPAPARPLQRARRKARWLFAISVHVSCMQHKINPL